MAFRKGHKKIGGRKKGAANKSTQSFKIALLETFVAVGDVDAFATWAKKNRTDFYKLCGRLIPAEMNLSGPEGKPLPAFSFIRFVSAAPTQNGHANGHPAQTG